MQQVQLAPQGLSEETNENGEVEHVEQEPLWVTWSPHDTESGVGKSFVCISLADSSDCDVSAVANVTVDGSEPSSVSFRDQALQVSTGNNIIKYKVFVVVVNGAGVSSHVVSSNPFLVLRANVAGTVTDGRGEADVDFSNDKSSVAVRFSGFNSDACGIVGYEWGIGTSPFATDVMPYTDRGLVFDRGHGFAQAHKMQIEGQSYYSTVRAKTGSGCHEEYIVASSDGFALDTTPPLVEYSVTTEEISSGDVVYQTDSDRLIVLWHATDASGLRELWLVENTYATTSRNVSVPDVMTDPMILSANLASGESLSSMLVMKDNAGNEARSLLPLVTIDSTPPRIDGLVCTKVVSTSSPLLTCEWNTIDEAECALAKVEIGLGSGPSTHNLLNLTCLPLHSNRWDIDVQDIVSSLLSLDFYVNVRIENAAGLSTHVAVLVLTDLTPPSLVDVSVVTSPRLGFHDVKQKCQNTEQYIEVLLNGLHDPESSIQRYLQFIVSFVLHFFHSQNASF